MRRIGESRILVGALVALALFCSLWTKQADAYPTFQFSGQADVAGFWLDPELGLDFEGFEVNYLINLTPTASTMYTEAVYGVSPHLLSQMAGSITLTGGFDSTTNALLNLNFQAMFNDPLFVAYDPEFLALSFGIDDGTGTTSEMLSVHDIGLLASYNLLTSFGPFLAGDGKFFTDGFTSGFADMDGNPLDIEVLVYDATVAATGGAAPVPEPATFLLLGAGLAGLGFLRWRKA